ncbi:MAG: triphosphoribosyl-dephospho-CoA synthase [Planctomycetaceae bacterium]
MTTGQPDWTQRLREMIRAACVWEASAHKPGNVHPGASFADVRFEDFVRSADVTAPVLAETAELGVGRAIREAVSVTRRAVGRNTNLGIILLIAPLAAVPQSLTLAAGIEDVLASLTVEDARCCYEAIREARPGGLGRAAQQDVADPPSVTLREAMRQASDRDRIAAQYVNGFADVLQRGLPILESAGWHERDGVADETAIIRLHLRLMSELPDTLIARKCGPATAQESALRAQRVLDAGWPDADAGRQELVKLDHWLRGDGHRRNPGTTADLVAAILFAALRDGQIRLPADEADPLPLSLRDT